MRKNQKALETILVLVICQGIVFWYTKKSVWLYAAIVIALLGVFFPVFASAVHYFWMKLAKVIGFVMSRILLSVIFYLILLPIALLSKLFSGKSRRRLASDSYFKDRNFTYTPESLENTW